MTLSIIIPTHKRPLQVQQLLNSIAEQNFPRRDLQVLLVSNLKDKILRKIIPHWEKVFFDFKYMETGMKGVNKARNMGIRFARGDILYFLDDDCLLDNKDQLSNLMLEHKKESIGIGGGYKTLEGSEGLEKFYQDNTDQWIKHSAFSKNQSEQLVGGNSSYKREVFDRGFYFDSSIVFGGSEEGFNRSLRAQGWNLLFVDKLSVLHKVKLNWFSFVRKSFKQGLGSVKSYSKTEKHSLKDKWAFLYKDSHSVYSLVYNVVFKLGFFWGLASLEKKGVIFQSFKFIFLFFKSRWYFIKWFYGQVLLRPLGLLWYGLGWFYGQVLLRPLGLLWYGLGWFYGQVLLRPLGLLWYGLGWFYGQVLLRPLGLLWYGLGWFYGQVLLRPLGLLWYGLGWFYGQVLLRPLGLLWYGLGWFYGQVLLRPLGLLWYGLGWFYGQVLLRPLGLLWYGLGWFYGQVLLRPLGLLWYGLGWFYGQVLLRPLGLLWYGLGWFYGQVLLRPLGLLWYGLGWFYGKILLFLFHHTPPMKLYYFSEYQYYKRIKPLLNRKKNSK